MDKSLLNNNNNISKLDLKNKNYDLITIRNNINNVDLIELLRTQKLTANFIAKYIINNKNQNKLNKMILNVDYVLKVQPHITRFEMVNALIDYDSDKDSFEEK